jgi:hypothetical protein
MQPLKQGHGDGSKVTAFLAQKNPDFHLYNAQRMGVSENGAYHPNAFPKAPIFGQTQILYRCLNMPPISPHITFRYPSTPYGDGSKPWYPW